ncbi:MAG: hypothetical protein HN849_25210 [Victivallales bacterium]|nr:hypothetical protein [Victivallales bacterium]
MGRLPQLPSAVTLALALRKRLPQDWQDEQVLRASGAFLYLNQRLQVQNANLQAVPEDQFHGVGKQLLKTAAQQLANEVHRAEWSREQGWLGAFEDSALRRQLTVSRLPMVCVELGQSRKDTVDVCRSPSMHQVQVEGRDGCPVRHGAYAAYDNVLNGVAIKSF